ncbi:MAG: DinB family protein [Chitinophagales bacterium]
MLANELNTIYQKHLDTLRTEIEAYADETLLWKTEPGINNSAGNLALHLTGNLQHFFGAILGNTGYVRKRDDEFGLKNVSREDLLTQIDVAQEVLNDLFLHMTDAAMQETYPVPQFGEGRSVHYVACYLLAHFDYHLGQINYHRRLLAGS